MNPDKPLPPWYYVHIPTGRSVGVRVNEGSEPPIDIETANTAMSLNVDEAQVLIGMLNEAISELVDSTELNL